MAISAVSAAAVAGCGPTASAGATPATVAAAVASAAAGQCRFVTAAEVEAATGLKAVKPTLTEGPCFYMLHPADVIPSFNPEAARFPPMPPVISFEFDTDIYADSIVDAELRKPDTTPAPGVGVKAASFIDSDGEYELWARLTNGSIRIEVDKPAPPQHYRTTNLTTIAVQLFQAARPRLS